MLKKCAVIAFAALFAVGAASVDAKRMGGGKTSGAKREAATQRQAATPPTNAAAANTTAASTAAPAAAAAKPAAAVPPAAAPKSGLSKWMPMLGGLALGAALASMFGGGAFGAAMANILMFVAIAMVGLLIWRWIAARRAGPSASNNAGSAGFGQPAYAGAGAGMATARTSHEEPKLIGGGSTGPVTIDQTSGTNAAPQAGMGFAPQVPAGFDVTGFSVGAKAQFNRLQAAFDKGDATVLKDMLTDEMFAEVDRELKSRGPNAHPTEVVTLNAEVIEVTTEADAHWASVRFHGLIREDGHAQAEGFDEIWNLTKALDGKTGWLLAGIQQL